MELLKYLIVYVAIGIFLSVDAFAACLAFGTDRNKTKNLIITPLAIGFFHIIFPVVAYSFFGVLKLNYYGIGRYISSTIFICLGLINLFKKEHSNFHSVLNLLGIVILAIGVSIDSFFIGISLSMRISNIILPACIFGFISFITTIIALLLSKLISEKLNIDLDFWAGLFFVFLGVLTFFNII